MKLKKASVVITGAARGLGAALSRQLAEKGAELVLSDIDGTDLQDLGVELDMPTMHCNVTDAQQVEALGRAAVDEYGKIDLWINNAGIWIPYVSVEELDINRAHQLMEVNYFGTVYGMREAMKHMRPKKNGVILNVLSIRSLKGKGMGAAYSASKFAAEGFTQAARDELKDSGVFVVGVYPYRIKTSLHDESRHADYDQSMDPADVAKIIIENLEEKKPAEHVEIWAADDVRKVQEKV